MSTKWDSAFLVLDSSWMLWNCHFIHVCLAAAAAAQALHLANQPPQQQMYSALAPTPPSMTPGPNPQSPQASFPSAQQTVYIHPQQVQHGYNHNHMAHVQQVGPDSPPPRFPTE